MIILILSLVADSYFFARVEAIINSDTTRLFLSGNVEIGSVHYWISGFCR